MQRRDVLKSMGGVAAMTTIGLAGCSGGGGCGKPSDGLEGALPDSEDYSMSGQPSSMGGMMPGLEGTVYAFYSGPDGTGFGFGITEFSDSDSTKKNGGGMSQTMSQQGSVVGRITAGRFLYFASGPDKDSVKEFMATAGPLDSDCVDSNVEFA